MKYIIINDKKVKLILNACKNCESLKNCYDNSDNYPDFLSPECCNNNLII